MPKPSPVLIVTGEPDLQVLNKIQQMGLGPKLVSRQVTDLHLDPKQRVDLKRLIAAQKGPVVIDQNLYLVLDLERALAPEWPGRLIIMTESDPKSIEKPAINIKTGMSNFELLATA